MMGFSIQHLIVVLIIVILLFGTKKIKNVGADVGGWIRDFKKAMREDTTEETAAKPDNGKVIEGEARTEHERV
ncbi:MAG: twin-arginine translocase TatA/TatE family subunit [Proteobacteria bacterium]|nr:twin-arginine translocase TatA/TatE family subunit [Pseudomonadota bacterium]